MRLYINGKFHTMNEVGSVHSSLLEGEGKIIELGKSEDLVSKYPEVEKIDLGGKTVIPGIIDTHTHLFAAAYSEMSNEIPIHKSVKSLISDLKKCSENTPDGEWIVYKNIYPLRLEELRYPTLSELDEASPENPVVVDGYYSAQLNSKALSMIDFDALPRGAEAIRNEDGSLTGVITCANAYLSSLPKSAGGDKRESLKKLMRLYNQLGMTMAVVGMCTTDDMRLMKSLYDCGEQTVRTRYTLPAVESVAEEALKIDCGDRETARVSFLKNFLDGGFLTGTAYMEYPYKNVKRVFSIDTHGKDNFGMILFSEEQIADSIRLARKYGLQYGAHDVGSGATKRLIASYRAVNDEKPIKGERHALIHADFLDEDMARDANEMGLSVLFQPAWHYMDAPALEEVLDERDERRFMDYNAISSCELAAAGSDHMVKHDSFESVNPYNPFLGMYDMVTCKSRDGKTYGKCKFTREQALAYYTREAAKATFDEDLLGTLEAGKRADFAVLDQDYFSCPDEEIPNIKSVMTVINGKRVL